MAKNPPANAGDVRDMGSIRGLDPLEKDMATHSSFLDWKTPMDRGASWATVHWPQRVRHNPELLQLFFLI